MQIVLIMVNLEQFDNVLDKELLDKELLDKEPFDIELLEKEPFDIELLICKF